MRDGALAGDMQDLLSRLRSLASQPALTVAAWIAALQEWHGCPGPSVYRERKLRRVVGHALFLLRGDTELFSACALRWQDGEPVVRLDRYAWSDADGCVCKIRVEVGATADGDPCGSFHWSIDTLSCRVWKHALSIDNGLLATGGAGWTNALTQADFPQFFENKRQIEYAIACNMRHFDVAHTTFMRAQAQLEYLETCRSQQLNVAADLSTRLSRQTHPLMPPIIHILPRLLKPRDGMSILGTIHAQLGEIRAAGFGALLLGVVDPQSTEVYYSEDAHGTLRAYPNDHGYWSSGQTGIDSALGTRAEYLALAAGAREHGLQLVQDAVFASLGYPAQLSRFGGPALGGKTQCLVLGTEEVAVSDPTKFIHDGPWSTVETRASGPDADAVETTLSAKLTTFMALPRPNLFMPAVLDAVLQRARWQIEQAGIRAFRVDMAKHIAAKPLRTILRALNAASADGGTPSFLLLEHLSLDYRQLTQALLELGEEVRASYLYDFPLAKALHRVLAGADGYAAPIAQLLAERAQARVPLRAFIPTFIDHDGTFTPVFTGTKETRGAVVAGFAMAILLSANYPAFYMAFDHPYADDEQRATRRVQDTLFADHAFSPKPMISELLDSVRRHGLLENWDDGKIVSEGQHDWVRICRTVVDPARQKTLRVEAMIASGASHGRDDSAVLFAYRDGPTVIIRLLE